MKPGDHPDFFRFPSPPGTSRESSLRLDGEGRFWHEGERVEHPRLLASLNAWIARHPDDSRYILTNGYDWTYFTVDDTPYFVVAVHDAGGSPELHLSDGTVTPLSPARLEQGEGDALYTNVTVKGGEFEAKFSRLAQTQLEPYLVEEGGQVGVRVGSRVVVPVERAGRGGR